MQCTVDHAAADAALHHLIRIIPGKPDLALLAGIQLDAADNVLRLTTTDLTHHLTATLPGTVDEPGTTVLPADLLHDLIHRLPDARVSIAIEPDTQRVVVRAGRHRAVLHALGAATLPEFPPFTDAPPPVSLPLGTLPALSRQLLFACATDESRPILHGVLCHADQEHLRFIATDGVRLSEVRLPRPDGFPNTTCVLPAKALHEAARLNAHDPVTLAFSDALVQCAAPGIVLTSRKLTGTYPDAARIMPATFMAQCTVAAAPLRQALDRMQIIAKGGRTNIVRVQLAHGRLEIGANAAGVGEGQEILDGDTDGTPLTLLLNAEFLRDALRSFDAETLHLAFAGPQAPLVIRAPDTDTYQHLLLPLRSVG